MSLLTYQKTFLASSLVAVLATAIVVFSRLQSSTYCYAGITTLSSKGSASCFTVSPSGKFTRVFNSSGVKVNEGYVIPGLWDGHGHLLQYGELLHSVDLFGVASIQEVRTRLKVYTATHPTAGTSQEWLRGVGWDQAAFSGRMPTAEDLESDESNDELAGKYVMLDRVDVHCIWVSKAVLALLPDPLPETPGGEVIREPGLGVFCDNAMDIVMNYWPRPGKEKKTEFVKSAMRELNKVGLVGMHDAGVAPQDLRLYEELAEGEGWSLRVYAMVQCEKRNTFCPKEASKMNRGDGTLIVRGVKLFADGALGSWGSALLEPYNDHPWTSGSLLVNASTLTSLTNLWASTGFQVNIHAIGDLANRLAIDAMSSALGNICNDTTLAKCQQHHRFRIEHAQIIHPDDQERMHALGIIPSIQPTHATSDMSYAETRLGQERTNREAYRMRSLLPLQPILGSDLPVEPPNPFQGIYAAVARRSPQTGLDATGGKQSWYPEECLTLEDALDGFTKGPARGAFLEGVAGVIEGGAYADWVVLDRPLEHLDVEDLRRVAVRETWLAGRRVYRRDD